MSKYLSYVEKKGKVVTKTLTSDGIRRWVHNNYEPELYVVDNDSEDFKSIDGKGLSPLKYPSIRAARDAIRDLGNAANSIYGYWKYSTAYICQAGYEVASSKDYNILYHDIETTVGQGFPNVHTVDQEINMITFIDRQNRIHAVTTCEVDVDLIETEFSTGRYEKYTCKVWKEETEEDLFLRLLALWAMYDPDIFIGFNSEKFDVPYIVNRMDYVLGEKSSNKLSPFGRTDIRQFVDDFGEEVITADIEGVSHIDLMQAYKKFVLEPRDSYSLDNLAMEDLKEGKLKHESGIPGHLLYHEFPTDGLRYNIVDVLRLKEIDEKKGVIDLMVGVAQMTKSNVEDTMFSTRLWMNMIYDDLRSKGIFFPIRNERNEWRPIEGGYVMAPVIGLHEWLASFDYASLYPSIIMGLNVGVDSKAMKIPGVTPDAILQGKVRAPEGHSMAANGQCYRKDKQSFMAEITVGLYAKRKEYKFSKILFQKIEQMEKNDVINDYIDRLLKSEEMQKDTKAVFNEYLIGLLNSVRELGDSKLDEVKRLASLFDNYDKSTKTLLNSLYGAMAEKNFYFYDPDVAESITLSGQYLVRNLGSTFTEVLTKNFGKANYWVASDTDSCYFSLLNVVKARCGDKTEAETLDWLATFSDTTLKKLIRKANDHACDMIGAYEPERFDADREVIGRRGVFSKKKAYAISIVDLEGVRYTEPHLKITGLAAKKSSTPMFFRDKMKKFFDVFLGEGDRNKSIDLIADVEEAFMFEPLDDIAMNINVKETPTKVDEEGRPLDKGVHINQRAIATHNWMISKDEKAAREIEPLQPGDKVRFVKLRMPNVTGQPVIAWKDEFPQYFRDIGIDAAIDKKRMYEDNFEGKLDVIFKACGIDSKVNDLDLF
ncbi:DNA polymerase [Agrobacterium phage OLIVR5]|uniref:DNA-directed DNA polymerase n=2 Tax=Caudoviricetes TaxID=2731619 RepID=A0A858MUT5_9CAUD|nr:DNA polymerase [Agrobacterium phage OLIVR5]QIW87670.1 DNA polymerase [Agrobacterium phage OLIVR5]QIW87929.1 DNA polymerase [Agrobacterium phage OLIVR6]